MLLLGHRNHRITIVSTPFTSLWIRYWPKLRFSDNFDLVARYYNRLDRELLQADRLFSQFKAAHVEKSIKTAAEVIEVLNENSLHEMTPELIKLKGRVHSSLSIRPSKGRGHGVERGGRPDTKVFTGLC